MKSAYGIARKNFTLRVQSNFSVCARECVNGQDKAGKLYISGGRLKECVARLRIRHSDFRRCDETFISVPVRYVDLAVHQSVLTLCRTEKKKEINKNDARQKESNLTSHLNNPRDVLSQEFKYQPLADILPVFCRLRCLYRKWKYLRGGMTRLETQALACHATSCHFFTFCSIALLQ